MSEPYQYDVFISHSAKDNPVVLELAERMKADGLRVWLDEWEIRPGDMVGLKINQGLEQSRTLVLMMSASASESEWVKFESLTIIFSDPTNRQRRFIPVRLDDAEIKETLKQFSHIDWRERSAEQYGRLLAACRQPVVAMDPVIEQKNKPQPGKVFRGHTHYVLQVAVTPDGRRIISGSSDKTLRVWDMDSGECLTTLKGHTGIVNGVAMMPDGRRLVSCSFDTLRVWDVDSGQRLATLEGHLNSVRGVAVMTDGQRVVSCSDDETLRIWDATSGRCLATLTGHTQAVRGVAIMPDGRRIVSSSSDKTLRVWDVDSGRCLARLEGHTNSVRGVAVTPDERYIISGSDDTTLRVWSAGAGKCFAILEGHTRAVRGVAMMPDGQRIISASDDETLRVWDVDSGQCLATLTGHTDAVNGVAVMPDGRRLVSYSNDTTLRMWELPPYEKTAAAEESGAARYTNAKVLLVGDSGVGKSGLAYRLTEDRFEPTFSTDAAWATQLKLPHDTSSKDTEREIWLWDFAGQADYRLIHQLFMDETSLAVLVFNPQSENPFEGLGQWDRDLQRAARRPFRKLLVAGRCDRGNLMVSRMDVEGFQQERGFTGYLTTSALTGEGCADLRDAIIRNIPWEEIHWTSTPRIFKLLKAEIVRLKDAGKTLLRMGELKQQLEMQLTGEIFAPEQLRAVVGLLAGPGIVWQLEFGDYVLLQPERINAYAAAVIRKVRAHKEEIGVISEEDVLAGRLDYQDMKRLPPDEEQIVLRAMHQTLVDHRLCLRETTETGALLVLPSYFKRERPELEDRHPSVFVTYRFNGQLDEIYSTLVVQLHHTTTFKKDQLWRFAADFKTGEGKRVGLKMTKRGEGAAEIAVYFDPGIAEDLMVTFIHYVHEHLQQKAQDVVRLRRYVCPHCDTPVENLRTAQERRDQGLQDIVCVNCEKRVLLSDMIEQKLASPESQRRVRELEEKARISIGNESTELILVGHAFAVAAEAGQLFRPLPQSDWGIDGEIEFKNAKGEASGKRVYLQLKSGDYYQHTRQNDGRELFTIKSLRHAEYWQAQASPVMLVIRASDGQIRWMNVRDYLNRPGSRTRQINFEGEPFTAQNLLRLKDRLLQ